LTVATQNVYPGMTWRQDRHGKVILRLHYGADPDKAAGQPIEVPELGMSLSPWAKAEYDSMTQKALYRQEYEIDGSATQGQLVYQLDSEATLEKSFPIPEHWTRRMSLDPHPAVPDAFLWVATDPWGDRWYYRELWPSVVCFRYELGELFGQAGPCPEEDQRFSIKDYVQTVRYLESSENPENRNAKGQPFDEKITLRVIDYAARAFAAQTVEGQKNLNFQQLYEMHMQGMCQCEPKCTRISPAWFEDAKKDHRVGEELVNQGLKPRMVTGPDGKVAKRSRIHIFEDRCPELVYQLKNARRQQLTPVQAERQDPTGKPVEVRLHMVDNIRYLEMCDPRYIEPHQSRPSYEPQTPGISY
jgi:hypothetical protein